MRETCVGIRIQRPSGDGKGQNITKHRCRRKINRGTGKRIADAKGFEQSQIARRLKLHDEMPDEVKEMFVRI